MQWWFAKYNRPWTYPQGAQPQSEHTEKESGKCFKPKSFFFPNREIKLFKIPLAGYSYTFTETTAGGHFIHRHVILSVRGTKAWFQDNTQRS